MDHEALEKEIRKEGYCLVMPPRMIHIGMDFFEYLENSKLYNPRDELKAMDFKKFMHVAVKTSKDIGELVGDTKIQHEYISAVLGLETVCDNEYDTAFRIIDYWWMANMLKSRHNDIKAHNVLRDECISYYSILKDESSKKYLAEHLGKKFLSIK